jgi:hypothetical protein
MINVSKGINTYICINAYIIMQVTHSLDTGGFEIRFVVHNKNHVDLSKLFNFDIINLLYLINKDDIIEQNHTRVLTPVEKKGDVGEANIQMLFHHMFKDCGIPQYYLNMNMRLEIGDNLMQYSSNIQRDSPDFIAALPSRIRPPKPMPISKMDICVEFPGPSMASVVISFVADDEGRAMMIQRERMTTMIFKRMFTRLKEFIETMT